MSTLYNRITPQRVLIWLIGFLGMVLAPVVTYYVCTVGLPLVYISIGVIVVAGWAFLARDRWWVPFPGALALGGSFYYGFKIPIHEMALVICLFPLLLALATRWQGAIPGRTYPSPSVFLLATYLVFHWIGSLIYNSFEGLGGAGNVTRNYMNAFWPMILFFSFYFFGNSKYIKEAFFLMYLGAFIRIAVALYSFFDPGFLFIRGINYIPSSTIGGADDLRAASQQMAMLSICYCCLTKGVLIRSYHFGVFLMCFPLLTFGGGRFNIVVFLMLPIFWLIIYRKYLWIIVVMTVIGSGVFVLNESPTALSYFPPKVVRSLSGLIFDKKKSALLIDTESSNEYHQQLRKAGMKRWLGTFSSFFIGCGVRPLNMDEWSAGSIEDSVKACDANTTYECALWNTLARFGIIGYILYLNVFRFLLADGIPQLWRKKITDYESAFAFITAFWIFIWIVMCTMTGSFPTMELMMGLFAKTLHDDQRHAEQQAEVAAEFVLPQGEEPVRA